MLNQKEIRRMLGIYADRYYDTKDFHERELIDKVAYDFLEWQIKDEVVKERFKIYYQVRRGI